MQSIINNRRVNRRHQATSASINTLPRRIIQRYMRRHFEFNNGYNRPPYAQGGLVPPTVSTSDDELPSILQYRFIETDIDVYVNNLTSDLENSYENSIVLQYNSNQYYSTFAYGSLNIRFFHNEPLNQQNMDDAMENVVHNINNREIENILSDFENSEMDEMSEITNNTLHDDNTTTNTYEIINKIEENVTRGVYEQYVSVLKNHTCPILLCDFENTDIIAIFKLCNHAIHESTYDKYVRTFTKCPLCNNKLFKL